MLNFITGILLPITAGVALLALCFTALAWNMNWLQPEQVRSETLMKILDRLTDRPELVRLLNELPTGRPYPIDRNAVRDQLADQIFGQSEVIHDVVEQIWSRFARTGRTQPVGVFMIAGPSGIGKTAFGKALGHALYGPNGYYLVDMTSLDQAANVNALLGAPPGYIGSDRSPSLLTHLAANPKTVVILDEFEKAHRDVQRRFLTAWEGGSLEDVSTGRRVSTTDVIFVLTVNAREEEIAKLATTPGISRPELSDRCKQALKGVFEAPVLDRIDHVFAYAPLEKEPFAALVAHFTEQLVNEFELELVRVDENAFVDYVKTYHGPDMKAREVRRRLESDLSRKIIAQKDAGAKRVKIGFKKGAVSVERA